MWQNVGDAWERVKTSTKHRTGVAEVVHWSKKQLLIAYLNITSDCKFDNIINDRIFISDCIFDDIINDCITVIPILLVYFNIVSFIVYLIG